MQPAAEPPPPPPLPAGLALELALDPAAAARLPRHPTLTAHRNGRSRGMAEELIWQDTAKGALAAAGLALECPGRGPARLLRILPEPAGPWRPGTLPEIVEDALPEAPLVPVAAFSGRRSQLALRLPEGPVQAVLLAGKLRAVADERPLARLLLEGPPAAVLALARSLAAELPLLPPDAALAEAGRALAQGTTPRPRRRGAPDLGTATTVEAALLGALGHLLEVMLHHAPACRLGEGPEGVHQLRVALRRLRSVLKVLRPAVRCAELDAFDAGLKRLAERLGPARDWDVFIGGMGATVAAALPGDRRIAALLKAAEARRQAAYVALRQELDGPGFRLLVLDGLALLLQRPWRAPGCTLGQAADGKPQLPPNTPLEEFAAPLLARRWRKLAAKGKDIAEHGAAALHELRLEAKRLRYAAELFAPLWPGKPARRFQKRLAALQEALGLANDAAVARGLVASLGGNVPGWAVGAVEGFATARAMPARKRALNAWDELNRATVFWPEA